MEEVDRELAELLEEETSDSENDENGEGEENTNRDCEQFHRAVVNLLFREISEKKGAIGVSLNQMEEREGVRMFGQQALDALLKEFSQLDPMEVFDGVMAKELSYEQKKERRWLLI